MQKLRIQLLLIASFLSGAASAAVTLPHYVTDNMIVQQNSIIKLKGKSFPRSEVKVKPGWEKETYMYKTDADGNFSVSIPTPPAGGPYSILFEDKDGPTIIENVLSGEVWICSGQSNMEFPVQGWTTVMDYDNVVATAHHPDIRLLQVKKNTALSPLDDVEVNMGGWQVCTSASLADFSAIAYFYARELAEKLKVPIGVIDTTWGGTPAESWTSAEALGAIPGFEQALADMQTARYDKDALQKIYDSRIEEWLGSAKSDVTVFQKDKLQAGDAWKKINVPGYWENSELPGFDGIVWLQKEIEIPEDYAGHDLTLDFSAIDDEDETYFNGTLVAKGSGYDTPRSYSVPASLVMPGKNVITMKVSDFGGEGGIAPGIAEAVIYGKTIPLQGEWQYMVGKDFSVLPPKPSDPNSSSYPSVLYNAMLSPLRDMPVAGTIWYQGCANVGRAEQYATLFKALIKDWRRLWGEKMPFYFVQLAGFQAQKAVQPESEWADLRNAQSKALELDNTAMAVAIDLGNPADIHPRNKQDVAHRLALIALNRTYGTDCVSEAPKCISATRSGNQMILKFNSPVVSPTTAVTGFIISGKDGIFTTATPTIIDDRTISLSSHTVDKPEFVRYNWADYPCGNLYGTTGLPVAPFATDN